MTFYYRLASIVVLLTYVYPLVANIFPVEFDERIDNSHQVVIAKIVNTQSYWGNDGKDIYTSYTMEVICYTKNPSNHYYIDLILPGGLVDEEVQINYPFVRLKEGHEYLVTIENIDKEQLNTVHLARSANPKYQPYSYIQGVLPSYNGYYHDYFDTHPIPEEEMLSRIKGMTAEQAKRPDGSDFKARTEFNQIDGDIDNDGVSDLYDVDSNNPFSDSDGDGISDTDETKGDGIYNPLEDSNPLSACDPTPSTNGCIGIDLDEDGFFANYPTNHAAYDTNDSNSCLPQNQVKILTAQKDTWINQLSPELNYGASTDIYLNDAQGQAKRGLLQFDLTALNQATALTAELSFFVEDGTSTGYNLQIHKLLQNWEEGTRNQALGFTNWVKADSNQPWQSTHYDPSPVQSEIGNSVNWVTLDLPITLIQEWIDNPSSNYGLLLRNEAFFDNDVLRISSKESINKPFLSITLDPATCGINRNRKEYTPPTTNTTTLGRAGITLKNSNGVTSSTFYAGTTDEENEMIIEGSGFGTNVGLIEFPNADNGGLSRINTEYGTDLVYWTDTAIRLKIPKQAGTGTMQVKTSSGVLIGSQDITIAWALNPLYHNYREFTDFTRQRVNFVDINGTGGYTIEINSPSGLTSNTEAVASFRRALSTWQCSSDVNFILEESGTSTEVSNDGNCIINFSTTLPAGVLAITSSRYKGAGNSNCSQVKTLWRLKEFDIEFAAPSTLPTGISWNFSEDNPSVFQFDFESIALHELGHAHGLAHVIDEESVMHFSIGNGIKRRGLINHELEASAHKMSYSLSSNCVTSYSPMTSFAGNENCGNETSTPATIANRAKVKVFIEGYYDAATNSMSTLLADASILPLEQPFNIAPFNYAGDETLAAIPSSVVDWMLLELRDESNMETIIHQQAVLLRSDGQLLTLNGIEDIPFNDLTAGNYFIALHHLNHLPIISNTAHPIQTAATLYDFTNSATAAMGAGQQKEKDGYYFMNGGDFDGNGVVNNEDYNLWKINSASVNIYSPADADGNGIINNTDYNLWKLNRSKIGLLKR